MATQYTHGLKLFNVIICSLNVNHHFIGLHPLNFVSYVPKIYYLNFYVGMKV